MTDARIFFSQLFVSAMGPPGGGRNDISSRMTRHMNIVTIDEFDDATMTRIFGSICDLHFGKGFEGSFVRNGKVSERKSLATTIVVFHNMHTNLVFFYDPEYHWRELPQVSFLA